MARKKRVEKHNSNRDRNNDYGVIPLQKTIPILPRNVAQEDYMYQLADPNNNIVFAIGPVGTGKTLLCTQMGIKSFMEREVKKIVITRPAVSVDEQHGFTGFKREDEHGRDQSSISLKSIFLFSK